MKASRRPKWRLLSVMFRLPATVTSNRKEIRASFVRGNSYLQIDYHSAPRIKEESEEIAEQFGLLCRDSTTRYEMRGDDPDMLFSTTICSSTRNSLVLASSLSSMLLKGRNSPHNKSLRLTPNSFAVWSTSARSACAAAEQRR